MSIEDQKFPRRATAYKLKIEDVISGEFVSDDFGSYLESLNLKITRVRVMGNVIDKRVYEGNENTNLSDEVDERGGHAFLTLDDGSGIIRLKTWKKDVEKLEFINIGDMVDTVSRVRKYQDEIYIVPEYVKKIENPNWELLRELEIIRLKQIYSQKSNNLKDTTPKISSESKKSDSETKPINNIDDLESVKNQILSEISDSKESNGLTRDELYILIDIPRLDINECINELMTDGKIFENSDGKIQKA
ncbi:MAG: hypothetical protein GF329_03080 [Candidatus Lokiarchaeota archaeon]|nr:hypothetical protein [Candidatus Lokiarchaeota archaeon]